MVMLWIMVCQHIICKHRVQAEDSRTMLHVSWPIGACLSRVTGIISCHARRAYLPIIADYCQLTLYIITYSTSCNVI